MKKDGFLRICTYNILHGQMTGGDEALIGRALADLDADIVGLQEVDVGTARVCGRDVLSIVAAAGGYPYYAFARAIPLGDGEYGTAVLSRYPIRSFTVTPLPSKGVEGRSLGHAVIDVDGKPLDFFNTHVAYENLEARTRHLSLVAEETARCDRYLLTGDFNTEELSELAVFAGYETVNPRALGSYYPKGWAIDHILVPTGTRVENVQMPTLPYSDHYPVLADVYL